MYFNNKRKSLYVSNPDMIIKKKDFFRQRFKNHSCCCFSYYLPFVNTIKARSSINKTI